MVQLTEFRKHKKGETMRVLFLTNIPSPYRVEFFNELGKLCDLTVLYERATASDRDSKWLVPSHTTFKDWYLKGCEFGRESAFCPEVIKWLRNRLFDIFVIGGYSTPTGMLAIEILNYRKIPFVLNADGGLIKNDPRYRYLIKKHFISSATHWLSTGENTSTFLTHYGANPQNIYIYPFTSINEKDIVSKPIDIVEKNIVRSKLGMMEDKIILSVGQFIHRKGYDILLHACEGLPKNYGIYIVGGTPTEEYISLKNEMHLENVHFVEFMTKKEIKEFYKAADIFVLPTREDIWGLVINEAMAFALPVITTNKCVAGLELIIDGENGFLIESENVLMLTQKIINIAEDNNCQLRMGEHNIEKIKRYSIENMAREHIRIFEQINRNFS